MKITEPIHNVIPTKQITAPNATLDYADKKAEPNAYSVSISDEAIFLQEVSKLFKSIAEYQNDKIEESKERKLNIPKHLYAEFSLLEASGNFKSREVRGIVSIIKESLESGGEEAMRRIAEKFSIGKALSNTDLKEAIEWIKSI